MRLRSLPPICKAVCMKSGGDFRYRSALRVPSLTSRFVDSGKCIFARDEGLPGTCPAEFASAGWKHCKVQSKRSALQYCFQQQRLEQTHRVTVMYRRFFTNKATDTYYAIIQFQYQKINNLLYQWLQAARNFERNYWCTVIVTNKKLFHRPSRTAQTQPNLIRKCNSFRYAFSPYISGSINGYFCRNKHK